MNKKIIIFCLAVIAVLCLVFFATKETSAKILVSYHKCLEPSVITTEQDTIKTYSYFSQCLCFVSDGKSEPIGMDLVKSTEFEAETGEVSTQLCNEACHDLCEKNLELFLQEHPDFKLSPRW